jgi:outer membrane protein
MKTKNLFLAGIAVVALATLGVTLMIWMNKPKTAYVDLGKVYSEFTLKKELEGKLQQVQLTRKSQLDSLELDLNVLVKNIQSNEEKAALLQGDFQVKRQQYALKSQSIDEEASRLTQTYDDQIWKQLNQYIREFGKSNSYQYIFGAEGSGALMYADDSDNITEQMVAYVNNRYKGLDAK